MGAPRVLYRVRVRRDTIHLEQLNPCHIVIQLGDTARVTAYAHVIAVIIEDGEDGASMDDWDLHVRLQTARLCAREQEGEM